MKLILSFLVINFILLPEIFSQSIELFNKDAAVWGREQEVAGKLNNFFSADVILKLNGSSITSSVNSSDSSFSFHLILNEGLSKIIVSADSIKSDTLKLTLGYNIRPEIYSYATVNGREVNLHASVIENPDTSSLSFFWNEDAGNPAAILFTAPGDSSVSFSLPADVPMGEYYFNLFTYSTKGDTVKSRTFITIDPTGIKPFNIGNDHAAWIDSAVIYEITPYSFTINGKFPNITAKIPEIAGLGVTTIWLQPVYATRDKGQGYDIIDYFKVRPDLGTEEELRELIQAAKSYGMKVIFDFVPNHSSIFHPYAEDWKIYGENSHFYNFYQREEDGAPYSQHYKRNQGFIYYFWDELPNLNYDNPEVQKWITAAAKYWIEEFDIDGYRFDAVWGVNARNPQFAKDLRLALKRIKPEILMLAEDKATWPSVFDERFDAAYDWAPEESWVSQWVWQYDFDQSSNPTIFNSGNVNSRASLLRNSLTNNGSGYSPNAKILRFLENNDQFHFITHHTLEQTKMAAALLFSLNGIPLLYNGQEAGIKGHPYEINATFNAGSSIRSKDQEGLFPYYRRLIELRKTIPALSGSNLEEAAVNPGNFIYGYRRWNADQNVFGVINMSDNKTDAILSIPVEKMQLDSLKIYYMTDMISGEAISGLPSDFKVQSIPVDGYTTRLFLFADTVMTVTGIKDIASTLSPQEFRLEQNYPNPFNPSTSIKFNLPSPGHVSLKIYDMLGEETTVLVNGNLNPGSHTILFNGGNLSSGIYFYRIEFKNRIITRKMILLK